MCQKRLVYFFVVGLLISGIMTAFGCSNNSKKTTITILAAASLTEVLLDLEKAYEAQNEEVDLRFNFAGTSTLVSQVKQGLEADVFISANKSAIDDLLTAGQVRSEAVKPFAWNRMILMVYKDTKFEILGMESLLQEGLTIVMGEPSQPIGKYTVDILEQIEVQGLFSDNYEQDFYKHVVSMEDSVKAIVAKVEMGEADAGIVYATDFTAGNSASVRGIEIPESCNPIAIYELALLKNTTHQKASQDFIKYMLGKEGQDLLVKYGFKIPE